MLPGVNGICSASVRSESAVSQRNIWGVGEGRDTCALTCVVRSVAPDEWSLIVIVPTEPYRDCM